MYEDGFIHSLLQNNHGRRSRTPLPPSRLQTFWTPPEGDQRQRHPFYVEIRERTLSPPRHFPEHFDGVSPSDGRTVGTNESVAGTISEVLDQSQTDELEGVLTNRGIRSQHVVQCHHKDVPLSPAHGIRPARHLGDNEVAVTPGHHTPRTDDRGTASGVRCAASGRSLVGATNPSTTVSKGRASVV